MKTNNSGLTEPTAQSSRPRIEMASGMTAPDYALNDPNRFNRYPFVPKAVLTVESRKQIETELLKMWIKQAKSAIAQGQTLNDFILHCATSDRAIARKAYRAASNLNTQAPNTAKPFTQK